MFRIIAAIIVLLSAVISGLFYVKYKVQNLSKDFRELTTQLEQEKEAIRVLKAEWSYLNQPERLSDLSRKYLGLDKIELAQIRKLDNGLPLYLAENNIDSLDKLLADNTESPASISRSNNGLIKKVGYHPGQSTLTKRN